MAEPPLVTTVIFPVVAPVGTVVEICVSEFTVKVAAVPLKATAVVCVKPLPVMVTGVPTEPLVGLKLVIFGVTLKTAIVLRVVEPVVTVILPVSAPAGT